MGHGSDRYWPYRMLYSQQRPGTRPFVYKKAKKGVLSTQGKIVLGVGGVLVFLLLVVFIGGDTNTITAAVGPASDNTLCDVAVDMSKVEVVSWDPRAFVYHGFLTDAECDHFIARAKDKGLKRSEVAAASKQESVNEVRTSYGTFISSKNDPVMQRVEERIAAWTHIPAENGEQFYFLQYTDGQQYKPHHDFFHEELPGMDKFIGNAGQRTATVLLYLHTPEAGGETVFPHTGKTVPAVRGDALLFFSHHPDFSLDPNSLHGGLPVLKGTKYCATKWIRLKQYHTR